jgi:hypothetical protein
MATVKSFSNEIYNVRGSGWTSPDWRWGYSVGTGHDCAMICRKKYAQKKSRSDLIQALWDPLKCSDGRRQPCFEEVKLILGLAWQNARWDGSDGGPGGYGDVLAVMADAKRYETGDDAVDARIFSEDMLSRVHLISSEHSLEKLKGIRELCGSDYDLLRRKCSAYVLSEMGFIEKGF